MNVFFIFILQEAIEQSLVTIHDIATENLGTLCISTLYRPLEVPINSERFESARQKADLAASILQEVGIIRHGGKSLNYIYIMVFFNDRNKLKNVKNW